MAAWGKPTGEALEALVEGDIKITRHHQLAWRQAAEEGLKRPIEKPPRVVAQSRGIH
jgi:hypothetical protein